MKTNFSRTFEIIHVGLFRFLVRQYSAKEEIWLLNIDLIETNANMAVLPSNFDSSSGHAVGRLAD